MPCVDGDNINAYRNEGGLIMIRVIRIAFLTMLLAVIGSAWATTELHTINVPAGAKTELVVFITPHIVKPIPGVCEEVEFTPVIAHFNGNTVSAGTNGISVAKGEISIEEGNPFVIKPGEYATVTIENHGLERKWIGVEFYMFPAEAAGECGPKASASVVSASGELIGTPIEINDGFKFRPVVFIDVISDPR